MGKEITSRENGKKGGRPPNSANKLTRATANALCAVGDDGLSGMADNMKFWRGKAQELGALLEEQLKSSSPEIQKEALRTVGPFLAARDKYHECSRDMAPYTNARLQAITIQKTSVHTEISMNLKSAADDTERTYRAGAVVPFKRAGS
jgi:hypothetical protein